MPLFIFGISVQDGLADPLLGRGVIDWPQEREASPVTVDSVLPGREGDVAAVASSSTLPAREATETEAFKRPFGEMQFCLRELAWWVPRCVRDNLDREHSVLLSVSEIGIYERQFDSRKGNVDNAYLDYQSSTSCFLQPKDDHVNRLGEDDALKVGVPSSVRVYDFGCV